jgi:hypothetical protein
LKKAILVGNGFTSQLIEDYLDTKMRGRLLEFFKDEYYYLNRFFDSFRISDISEADVYDYGGGLYPSETLFPGDNVYPQSDRILYNDKIRVHVTKALEELGFQNAEDTYDMFFIQYGLVFEVAKPEISAIENLLKVTNMFVKIGSAKKETEDRIVKLANTIYYNEGVYGLKDTQLMDHSKIKQYFARFDYIFTTNYDLILDDIFENGDKVFHLHGGFNIEHPNLKSAKRLTHEEAFLVWGINGDEKYQFLSSGFDFGKFRFDAVRYGQSLLADYFALLEEGKYEELHIFGYSGQNDQHINKRIVNNTSVKHVYFYCDPVNEVNEYKFQIKVKELFQGSKAEIVFEPWTKVWDAIRS